jgi:hypothetical protein
LNDNNAWEPVAKAFARNEKEASKKLNSISLER